MAVCCNALFETIPVTLRMCELIRVSLHVKPKEILIRSRSNLSNITDISKTNDRNDSAGCWIRFISLCKEFSLILIAKKKDNDLNKK